MLYSGDNEEIDKCAQYWPTDPNATESFGHIQVTTLSESTEDHLGNTTLRTLHLKGIFLNLIVFLIHFSILLIIKASDP